MDYLICNQSYNYTAMVMTVRPLNDIFIASNNFFSVSSSTELVGSSIIKKILS